MSIRLANFQFSSYTSATVEFIRPSFSTGAILIVALLFPSFCAADDLIGELEADLGAGRLAECSRRADVPDAPPRASYLGGLCFLGLNDRDGAEPLIRRAESGGFHPVAARRKSPGQLLSDIAEYRRLAPAPAELDGVPASSLLVAFDRRSPWVDSIAAAAPGFVRIGRSVFGADPPFTRLFLYSDNATFEKFYGVVFGPQRPTEPAALGIAVMTEKNARDRPGRASVAVVLHELTHAWIQGYGRDVYGSRIKLPAWADEGMADYVGAMWDTGLFERRRGELAREIALHPQPPGFALLQKSETFHRPEDDFLDYGLSLLLVERLVGPPKSGAPLLRKVLDGYATGSDGEAAWSDVARKSPSEEYSALCAELWKKPSPK